MDKIRTRVETDEQKARWELIRQCAEGVRLWPESLGGKGEGVLCPCCLGNEYVTPETAETYRDKCGY